jgi:hypothetical protein
LLWLVVPGCYLAHGREAALDADRTDAGRYDTGEPDAGPPRALRWVPLSDAPGAVRPPARYLHYAVVDPAGDRMIVLGGMDPNCCGEPILHTDVWALALGDGTWTRLGDLSRPLLATTAVEAALDVARRRIVIVSTVRDFGGLAPETVAVDLASFAVTPLPDGPWPHPGGAVRATFDASSRRIVVHDAYYIERTEGVWTFDLGTDTWQTVAVDGSPGQLFHAPLTMIAPDRAVVYSGYDGETGTSGIWLLDLSARRFDRVDLAAEMGGRFSHRAVFEPVRGTLVVFGGSLFTIDRGTLLVDLRRGALEAPTLSPEAPPRYDHTMAFDAVRRRAIVFGGAYQSESVLDDTWALELP